MMKDSKGQALVEFIIIIPIFILILFVLKLEDSIDIISEMYASNHNDDINNYVNTNNISITISKDNDFTTITVEKEVDVNTIILNDIIGHKYKISADKIIYSGDNHE